MVLIISEANIQRFFSDSARKSKWSEYTWYVTAFKINNHANNLLVTIPDDARLHICRNEYLFSLTWSMKKQSADQIFSRILTIFSLLGFPGIPSLRTCSGELCVSCWLRVRRRPRWKSSSVCWLTWTSWCPVLASTSCSMSPALCAWPSRRLSPGRWSRSRWKCEE